MRQLFTRVVVFSPQRLTGMSQKICDETTHDDIITFEVVKLTHKRETTRRLFIVE